MALLHTYQINIQRGGNAPRHLSFPDIVLEQNESVLLSGPSGSGKTTFLLTLAGLLSPQSGQVTYMNQDIYTMPEGERDKMRGKNFGFLFQNFHLIPSLTVYQNIQLAIAHCSDEYVGDIHNLLNQAGLGDKSNSKPDQLSQGEQQRVALIRAIIHRPRILIADEPTSALDDIQAENVLTMIMNYAKRNQSGVLVASHDNRITHMFSRAINI